MYRGVVLLHSPRDNLHSVPAFGYNSIQRPVIVVSISIYCFYTTFLECFLDQPSLPCDILPRPLWSAKYNPRITMPTQSPYTWINPVHQVAFRMNSTDNTELNFICCTEAALGQATALANIPLTGTESPTDLKTLLLRCRELLKHLDHTNVHRWEIEELVPS